jgi:hypothetical protein
VQEQFGHWGFDFLFETFEGWWAIATNQRCQTRSIWVVALKSIRPGHQEISQIKKQLVWFHPNVLSCNLTQHKPVPHFEQIRHCSKKNVTAHHQGNQDNLKVLWSCICNGFNKSPSSRLAIPLWNSPECEG